ncbi:hypothetical protein [Pedobacter sp. NJ-S-72]
MHGICLDYKLQDWFDFKIPKVMIPSDFIEKALKEESKFDTKPTAKVVWLGGKPDTKCFAKHKKGNSLETMILTFHDKKETFNIQTNKNEGEWLASILQKIAVSNAQVYTFKEIKADFETTMEHFELFWYSKPIYNLRDFGLLVL